MTLILSGTNGVSDVDGTAAAPAIRGTDSNTGIFFPAADTIAFSEGGVESGRFTSTGALQLSNNLTFTGTGNRITGDFSNATFANRVMFQTSTGNSNTSVGAIPTGTAITSNFRAHSTADPTNASTAELAVVGGSDSRLTAGITGTGTFLPMTFYTGGSERMRLDTSGNLGLGVTPSANSLSKNFDLVGGAGLFGYDNGAYLSANAYFDSTWRYKATAPVSVYVAREAAHFWYAAPSGTPGAAASLTQTMTLDASGNLLVGTTTAVTQISFTGGDGITYQRSTDNSFSGVLDYRKSRGSAASPTAVQNGDDLFTLRVAPYHGSAFTYLTSQVVQVDGGFTSGQNPPTRIAWYTNAANGSSTERARIDSSGNLLIGTTNTDPSGNSVNGTVFQLSGSVLTGNRVSGVWGFIGRSSTTGDIISFRYNGVQVGSISTNGTGVTYGSSSDYRLKDNQQPLTNSGAFIDALKPKTWTWKADGSKGVGFIAHEVQEVSPSSVTGEKDGEQMQAMEYGSAEFIANIVAELQSLRARVAQLEAK